MNRYRAKKKVFSFLKTFMLFLLVVIIAFPFWQLIVSSMLDTNAIISYPPKFCPSGGSLDNYTEVLKMQGGAISALDAEQCICCRQQYGAGGTGGIHGRIRICKKKVSRFQGTV